MVFLDARMIVGALLGDIEEFHGRESFPASFANGQGMPADDLIPDGNGSHRCIVYDVDHLGGADTGKTAFWIFGALSP